MLSISINFYGSNFSLRVFSYSKDINLANRFNQAHTNRADTRKYPMVVAVIVFE